MSTRTTSKGNCAVGSLRYLSSNLRLYLFQIVQKRHVFYKHVKDNAINYYKNTVLHQLTRLWRPTID